MKNIARTLAGIITVAIAQVAIAEPPPGYKVIKDSGSVMRQPEYFRLFDAETKTMKPQYALWDKEKNAAGSETDCLTSYRGGFTIKDKCQLLEKIPEDSVASEQSSDVGNQAILEANEVLMNAAKRRIPPPGYQLILSKGNFVSKSIFDERNNLKPQYMLWSEKEGEQIKNPFKCFSIFRGHHLLSGDCQVLFNPDLKL